MRDPRVFRSMGCTVADKTSRDRSFTAVRASLLSEVRPWLISCWDPAVSGAARAAACREEGKSVLAREANAAPRVPLDLALSGELGLGVSAKEFASWWAVGVDPKCTCIEAELELAVLWDPTLLGCSSARSVCTGPRDTEADACAEPCKEAFSDACACWIPLGTGIWIAALAAASAASVNSGVPCEPGASSRKFRG